MRAIINLATLFLVSFSMVSGSAYAAVNVGMSIGDEGLRGFYFAVGDYFRVPEREVMVIRERRIPDEEIPVILFIAQSARVAPSVIIDLRLRRKSWMDIVHHYRLSPEIFYVPVKEVKGPPYGKAYGYYHNKPRKEWKKIVLKDPEVINLVNLQFVSKYHGHPPEKVIEMRSGGRSFLAIHDEFRRGKGHKEHGNGEHAKVEHEKRENGKDKEERGREERGKGEAKGKGAGKGKGK